MKIPGYKFEENLWAKGLEFIVGADEVGRGAWAGPLLAAAVILPKKHIKKLRDSKLLDASHREIFAKKIKSVALAYAFGLVSIEEINQNKNIHFSNKLAIERAISGLNHQISHVLIDGRALKNLSYKHTAIVKGDQKCVSISAASILAKVERDKIMTELAKTYPNYGFEKHKGYGTKLHQKNLELFGPSEIHRMHYKPFSLKLF